MHFFDRFSCLILYCFLNVHYALSFSNNLIFKCWFFQLLYFEVADEISSSSVSSWHLFLVVHRSIHLIHLINTWSCGPPLKFLKEPLDVQFTKCFLYLGVLVFSHNSLLLSCPLHFFIHLVSKRLSCRFHFLSHSLILLIIPHFMDLLFPVIIFALMGVFQDIVHLCHLREMTLVHSFVDIRMILFCGSQISFLKLLFIRWGERF